MIVVRPGELEHEVRLERRAVSTATDDAGSDEWELVDTIWISLRDVLPSRGEQADGGFTVATRRSRVRMYYRDDIDGTMRLVLGDRVMNIVAGPVELGRRGGTELMVETYDPTGNAA